MQILLKNNVEFSLNPRVYHPNLRAKSKEIVTSENKEHR
ncbi:hypothetical protein B602_0899 [Chlamydia psittaci M56]|nr:hypothetical protein B602_0899 [Chlamydia psittaci M56]